MVTVVFEGVPKGRYALTALQDVDGTSSLDRDFLDRPLEPFATSAKDGAAGFAPASFEVAGETSKVIRLKEPRSVEGTFDLTVTVAPVSRQKGSVRALLWNDRGGFPIDLKGKGLVASRRVQIDQPRSGHDAEAPRKTRVTILFRAVPRGEYAVTAFHDEDDDGKVDRSFFGKPTEPVGLSNNPPRRMRMPAFQPSAVQLRRDLSIDLRLR